jgi:hypothetical protein
MASVSFGEIMALVSPEGQQQLIDFVRRAREERGAGWLEAIKTDYPTFCWIADLVANNTGEEAVAQLQKQFPLFPLAIVKTKLLTLHAALQAEIDKPR